MCTLIAVGVGGFLQVASRIMERAIAEDVDIFTDYLGDVGLATPDAGEHLRASRQFADERWSRHRSVTSLDWSPEFPELLLASYDANADAPHEPDGVTLIWNLKYKKTSPEYVFHCQSPIMAACFTPFHPNLVIGGTYSGQVGVAITHTCARTHTHVRLFNGLISGTTQVSRYQKGKTSLDVTEARDSEWHWHHLVHMQVCTSLQIR